MSKEPHTALLVLLVQDLDSAQWHQLVNFRHILCGMIHNADFRSQELKQSTSLDSTLTSICITILACQMLHHT